MKRFLLTLAISIFTLGAVIAQDRGGIAVSNSIKEKTITISPNPAINEAKVLIEGNQFGVKSIMVFSIIGSEVYSQSFNNSPTKSVTLDLRNFRKGKYMVRVVFLDGSSEVTTLIKQ